MPTNTITIEVPEGYEAVSYRPPQAHEYYLVKGRAQQAGFDYDNDWLVLRRVWQPPAWMPKGAWLVNDPDVDKWYFNKKCVYIEAEKLAALHGEVFEPPTHTNCLQVQ
jgi:hypothetical protein